MRFRYTLFDFSDSIFLAPSFDRKDMVAISNKVRTSRVVTRRHTFLVDFLSRSLTNFLAGYC